MAGEILYFRGATLGTLARDYGVGGSAPFNVTSKTRMQGGTYAPVITPDKLVQAGPVTTAMSFDTVEDGIVTRAATITDVTDDIANHVGKVGVLKIGSTTVANNAICSGVALKEDGLNGYKKIWNFTAIGNGMNFYNEIKNGGFEACDDQLAPSNWTITAGAGADIITTQVMGTEGFGSGAHMVKFTCPTTPAITTHMKQTIGVALADDTTDNYFLKFSIEAMFQNLATTQTVSYITLQILRNAAAFTTVDLKLISNQPQLLSVAVPIGTLYHVSESVIVGVIASTSAAANDIIYLDNAKLEEVYTTELY